MKSILYLERNAVGVEKEFDKTPVNESGQSGGSRPVSVALETLGEAYDLYSGPDNAPMTMACCFYADIVWASEVGRCPRGSSDTPLLGCRPMLRHVHCTHFHINNPHDLTRNGPSNV
ncbi:hypothetical protein MRX96_040158 [Rhipicephalus microplus]